MDLGRLAGDLDDRRAGAAGLAEITDTRHRRVRRVPFDVHRAVTDHLHPRRGGDMCSALEGRA